MVQQTTSLKESNYANFEPFYTRDWCENMATCETNRFLFYKDANGCGDFEREGELVPG